MLVLQTLRPLTHFLAGWGYLTLSIPRPVGRTGNFLSSGAQFDLFSLLFLLQFAGNYTAAVLTLCWLPKHQPTLPRTQKYPLPVMNLACLLSNIRVLYSLHWIPSLETCCKWNFHPAKQMIIPTTRWKLFSSSVAGRRWEKVTDLWVERIITPVTWRWEPFATSLG